MNDEMSVEMIGSLLPDSQFELNEAIGLLNSEVVRIQDRACLPNPPIEAIGIICGVITMNDEVEIIVKFYEGIVQFNKVEFLNECSQV